jgi:hypothetical protein
MFPAVSLRAAGGGADIVWQVAQPHDGVIALLFWTFLWGIPGAVISVPLLSCMKILLLEADHPLAYLTADAIREDPKVDEAFIVSKKRYKGDLALVRPSASLPGS